MSTTATSHPAGEAGQAIPTTMTIAGSAVVGRGAVIEVLNPASEAVLGAFAGASEDQAQEAILAARGAFDGGSWSGLEPAARAGAMHRFADALDAHAEELLELAVTDVGTPIALARSLHRQLPLDTLRAYADLAAIDRTEPLALRTEDAVPNSGLVNYMPVGVVAAITPYNYPAYLACQKAGAALAAGCTVVLMPSPLAPLATLRIGELTRDTLPAGALNVIAGGAEIGRLLSEHPAVDKVSFTGSVRVGMAVMEQAAKTVKDIVLELGGKSANLLLADVDLAIAVPAVHGRYLRNAGQGCASPTRLIVERRRIDEFVERSRAYYAQVPVGPPTDERTIVGPVISAAHRERVERCVAEALADGAELLAGSTQRPNDGPGYYVSPALIGGVENTAAIAREEIFGPVGVVLPYDDVEEAIAIANDSDFGLSGNVFSGSVPAALAVARRLRAGHVTINGGAGMRPDAPFGGLKHSGIGREGGEWGVREFLEPQQIQWPVP